MVRVVRWVFPLLLLAGAVACYRLPLRIKENDASGYEDIGIPVIEAVEYTPAGRDLRVTLESSGYVTVIIVDPDRGATVRFRRGDLKSRFAEKGLHRYPLDRLSSPMLASRFAGTSGTPPPPKGMGRAISRAPLRMSSFDPTPVDPDMFKDSTRSAFRLSSRSVATGGGAVTSTHVVVLVSERPLDLVNVAIRLARGSLDPALVARAAADVVEGGRWMAAMAPLRGQ
jgi:hypothetical protein